MNRRGFIGAISALAVAPLRAPTKATPPPSAPLLVKRADGMRFVVGVATETVRAGDFVQIQTYGPVVMDYLQR